METRNSEGPQVETDQDLVVLTRAGAQYGLELLEILASKGIRPKLLIVEHTTLAKRARMAKFLARKIGWRDAIRYNIRFWIPHLLRILSFGMLRPLPSYEGLADKVVETADINSVESSNALAEQGAKKVILGQCGIIRKPILQLPNIWVVNAHPGKLPEYRGVDVVRWACLERAPIEVTLHIVDSGVDTGAVLACEPVPVEADDTWRSVQDRAVAISLDLLSQAAIHGPQKFGESGVPAKSKGKQYYLMPFHIARDFERQWPEILQEYVGV